MDHLEQYGAPEFVERFEELLNGFQCQRVACAIAANEQNSVIYSFNPTDNPEAKFFDNGLDDDGHVFCVIDDRWIVDPWVVGTYYPDRVNGRAVFDLQAPEQAGIIQWYYGDRGNWVEDTSWNNAFNDVELLREALNHGPAPSM